MDGARLKAGGMDGVQHLAELPELCAHLRALGGHGVELGVDAGKGHVGQRAVGQQDLLRLPNQKAAEAHAGVHLDVGLRNGGAVLRHRVQGQSGIH